MRGGGRDDVERVGIFSGFGDGIENAQFMFRGDFFCRVGMRVENSREFDLSRFFECGINPRMMLTERAGAEDGDFDFCHARSLPVRDKNLNVNFAAGVAQIVNLLCRGLATRWRADCQSATRQAASLRYGEIELSTFNRQPATVRLSPCQ